VPVITCPDCNRDVSTMAAACPHCGRPSPAGTAPIVAATPQAREETLWRGRPSARVLIGRVAAAVVVAMVGGFMTWGLQAGPIGWTITALTVAVMLIALAIRWIQIRSTLYTISNQRVTIERGILSKSVEEIDLRYIEDTRFFQSFFERLLGIGNVTLVSADKTTPTFVLSDITEPRQIRELVRTQAYQVSQRQVFTRMT
jgi:uncharacterized membrane protein YdbT with pleckstrin-like domain